ncbi:MAG: SDR family oxidoreductase [Alphaproteobacteria bacterium]|nr:SDR family oxidoreductase [Alphaproteobacteria bacterium]
MKFLITGASGLLGQGLLRYISTLGTHEIVGLLHHHPSRFVHHNIHMVTADLRDEGRIDQIIHDEKPDVVIHTAGLTSVDECEKNPEYAFLINTEIPRRLAHLCHQNQIRFIFISTDHITDGRQALFSEDVVISPVNIYAQTKAQAEHFVGQAYPESLIIRTNFFGKGLPWRQSLTDWIWQKLSAGESVPAFIDSWVSPLSVPYLSKALYDLSPLKVRGILHVGGRERISKYDFALKAAQHFGFNPTLVVPTPMASVKLQAPRPPDMSMNVSRAESYLGYALPDIDQSLSSIRAEYQGQDGH